RTLFSSLRALRLKRGHVPLQLFFSAGSILSQFKSNFSYLPTDFPRIWIQMTNCPRTRALLRALPLEQLICLSD
ncbi:hypothetical protein M5D96_011363, partial [Drosophila gunungcola]